MRGLSPVVASGDHSSSRCAGLSLSRPLLLRSTGSRRASSVIGAHGPSCSTACGIFPDQGSNPCPLHWQADSQPLRHQGSPILGLLIFLNRCTQSPFPLRFFNSVRLYLIIYILCKIFKFPSPWASCIWDWQILKFSWALVLQEKKNQMTSACLNYMNTM